MSAVDVDMGDNKKPEAATQAVELVDYQKGSVVSKTIIEKKTGTVTIFCL